MPCGSNSKVKDVSPILDVQKIIQDWAWDNYIKDAGMWRRLTLRRSAVDVDVQMNYYQFEDSEAELEDVRSSSKPNTKSKTEGAIPNTHVLSTDYENDTNSKQHYKFRMERARTAAVNVTFQTGFSVGGKANFSIGVSSGELETRLEITKTTGQTFQETLTFETNSDIKVDRNSICTAQVIFTERDITKKFTVTTTMRMPSGSAPIFIRRKKDQKLYSSFSIRDLRIMFRKYIKDKVVEYVEVEPVAGEKRYGIVFQTTGIIEGMRLSGQTVKLHSRKIGESRSEPLTANETLKEHKLRERETSKSEN